MCCFSSGSYAAWPREGTVCVDVSKSDLIAKVLTQGELQGVLNRAWAMSRRSWTVSCFDPLINVPRWHCLRVTNEVPVCVQDD